MSSSRRKEREPVYYIPLILKEMRSCQQLKVRISFLGIINICSQYLIFFFSHFLLRDKSSTADIGN